MDQAGRFVNIKVPNCATIKPWGNYDDTEDGRQSHCAGEAAQLPAEQG